MKKFRIGLIGVLTVAVLLMSLNLIATAAEEKKEAQRKEQVAAQSAMELYQSQVKELEKKLEDLKEEQYVNNKAYEEKIDELELKLLKNEDEKSSAEDTYVSDAKYTYTVSGDTITITGYSGSDEVLKIPSEIDGLKVTVIGREAFKGAGFKQVNVPSSVEKIDWFAFSECLNLKKINIPIEVSKIEYGAFNGVYDVTIVCVKNSYAHRYAKSYGFSIETK